MWLVDGEKLEHSSSPWEYFPLSFPAFFLLETFPSSFGIKNALLVSSGFLLIFSGFCCLALNDQIVFFSLTLILLLRQDDDRNILSFCRRFLFSICCMFHRGVFSCS